MKSTIYAGALLCATLFGLASTALAQTTPFNRQMSLGMSGADVSALQTVLASNPDIYPRGLVTGYFGPMTYDATSQFQLNYGLPAVGRVGPLTLQRLNAVQASGMGLDISAPVISSVSVQPSRNSVVVSWATNGSAQGKVFYSTQPLSVVETDQVFTAPMISGSVVMASNAQGSQSLTIGNLQPNTTYYYSIVATDASGNVSMTWPATFITQQ